MKLIRFAIGTTLGVAPSRERELKHAPHLSVAMMVVAPSRERELKLHIRMYTKANTVAPSRERELKQTALPSIIIIVSRSLTGA